MKTPVALIIFNRPNTTAKVFAKIAEYRPEKLFVIADGPRSNNYQDVGKCAASRAIIDQVDWDCEVFKDYSDINLGCGCRPATGISWVFENVEEAIILEDDCVPDITFFRFCEELLERYRNNEDVWLISGIKPHIFNKTEYSYHFSCLPFTWGWATWRRSWSHYDFVIKKWSELQNLDWLENITGNRKLAEFYKSRFDKAHNCEGDLDYWDYQWVFSCWSQNGLAIIPKVNLVANIGIGKIATHTHNYEYFAKIFDFESRKMEFPLNHPNGILFDRKFDMNYFKIESLEMRKRFRCGSRLKKKLRKLFKVVYRFKD